MRPGAATGGALKQHTEQQQGGTSRSAAQLPPSAAATGGSAPLLPPVLLMQLQGAAEVVHTCTQLVSKCSIQAADSAAALATLASPAAALLPAASMLLHAAWRDPAVRRDPQGGLMLAEPARAILLMVHRLASTIEGQGGDGQDRLAAAVCSPSVGLRWLWRSVACMESMLSVVEFCLDIVPVGMLLEMPAYAALHQAVQQDLPLQRRLLQLALRMLGLQGSEQPAHGAHATNLPGAVKVCAPLLACTSMRPALTELAAAPAGLRILQAAAAQLRSTASGSSPQGSASEAPLATAALLRLLFTLAAEMIELADSPARTAVAARVLVDTLPHSVPAVRRWLEPGMGPQNEQDWRWIAHACEELGAALEALSESPELAEQLLLQAAVCALHALLRLRWQLGQLAATAAAAAGGSSAAQLSFEWSEEAGASIDLCLLFATSRISSLCACPPLARLGNSPVGAPVRVGSASAAATSPAAIVEQLWSAHSLCASLLLSLAAADEGPWSFPDLLPRIQAGALCLSPLSVVLTGLQGTAANVFQGHVVQQVLAAATGGRPGGADASAATAVFEAMVPHADSLLLAHLAVLHDGQQSQASSFSFADAAMLRVCCPSSLLPVFSAAGGPAMLAAAARRLCELQALESGMAPASLAQHVLFESSAMTNPPIKLASQAACAAELVQAGLFSRLLRCAEAAARQPGGGPLAGLLGSMADACMSALRGQAAEEAERLQAEAAAPAGPVVASAASLAAQSSAAAASAAGLEQASEALEALLGDQEELFALPSSVADVLQPVASRVAALLQPVLAEPQAEQRAELTLLLARAVALRPCANLLCPHLAGADEGCRGKRCSGCRTARFCCAACSEQAWRAEVPPGGHRAGCRALQAAS
ncbi:hypothetical protein ABPG75_002479 [Micractinium tetrahymenae]